MGLLLHSHSLQPTPLNHDPYKAQRSQALAPQCLLGSLQATPCGEKRCLSLGGLLGCGAARTPTVGCLWSGDPWAGPWREGQPEQWQQRTVKGGQDGL